MTSRTSFALALALFALVGCDNSPEGNCVPGMSVACTGASGCSGFQTCLDDGSAFGACMCGAPMDAGDGTTDAGEPEDGGDTADAGGDGVDAGDVTMDAGDITMDAGDITMDAGGPDAGAPDAGAPDAGRPDAGAPDAGAPDAGPTGCFPGCGVTQRCCGSTCVNRSVPAGSNGRSDPSFNNCTGCGLACNVDRASACSSPGGGPEQCMCGFFAQCLPGEVCVADPMGYRCANLNTDPNNCGMVGNVCPGGETCSAGRCVCGASGATCGAGSSCCTGVCRPSASDPMNCGGCGIVCGAHAPNCVAGTCQCGTGAACVAPGIGGPIGGGLGETCCAGSCRANSDTSCSCGTACAAPDVCVVDLGFPFPTMSGGVCCGTPGPFGGICSAP